MQLGRNHKYRKVEGGEGNDGEKEEHFSKWRESSSGGEGETSWD